MIDIMVMKLDEENGIIIKCNSKTRLIMNLIEYFGIMRNSISEYHNFMKNKEGLLHKKGTYNQKGKRDKGIKYKLIHV